MDSRFYKASGITGLILGIVGMVMLALIWISTIVVIIGIIVTIIATIFGAVAYFSKEKNKFGLAGFILGLIGLILMVVIGAAVMFYQSGEMIVNDEINNWEYDSPTISYMTNSNDYSLTITSVEGSYRYADYSNNPNLVFNKDNSEYYVGYDYDLTLYGSGSTSYISAGDEIYGFEDGSYTMIWVPSSTILGEINFY